MKDSKKQLSLNAFAASLSFTILQGLLGFIVTRLILSVYGSDFNGINATANQFINVLLLLEGGFTLSTNVALFKPIVNQDEAEINQILSATSRVFHKVGILFLIVGIIGSYFFAKLIRTDLGRMDVFLLFIFTLIPSAFNLFFTAKYDVLLRAEQKEYLITLVNMAIVVVTQLSLILITSLRLHYFAVRIVQAIGLMLGGTIIVNICKRNHKNLDLSVEPNYSSIKGTRDVLIQKITSLIYGTTPVLYISMLLGSLYVSVYAVYNSVFSLIKNVLYSLVNAPRMSFGTLIVERETIHVRNQFLLYEFIVIFFSTVLFTSVYIMTMPFIHLYTTGLTDVLYADSKIPLLLTLIGYFEIMHIPSGHIINMSGNFRYSKKFQLVATAILVVSIPAGAFFLGFIGVLLGILITAVSLAIMEMGFIHLHYFPKSMLKFARILIANIVPALIFGSIGVVFLPAIHNYVMFLVLGFLVLVACFFLVLCSNLILNRIYLTELWAFIKNKFVPKIRK